MTQEIKRHIGREDRLKLEGSYIICPMCGSEGLHPVLHDEHDPYRGGQLSSWWCLACDAHIADKKRHGNVTMPRPVEVQMTQREHLLYLQDILRNSRPYGRTEAEDAELAACEKELAEMDAASAVSPETGA